MSSKIFDKLLKYTIPDSIKNRIPEYFYYALGGEYVSIMGATALIRDEDGLSLLDYDGGTSGYVEAFRLTNTHGQARGFPRHEFYDMQKT